MGCDIHGWIEKRVGYKWVAHQPIRGEIYEGEDREVRRPWGTALPVDDRNYEFFGFIAGVRGSGPAPGILVRGFPSDASHECRTDYEQCGQDAHTPSWLTLEAAADQWWRTASWEDDLMTEWDKKFPCIKPFGIAVPDGEYRFVFWFDN